jgi:hypothetical protein
VRVRGGIYLGYVGHANLGDEAMWEVCRRRFAKVHWSHYGQLAYPMDPRGFLARSRARNRQVIEWLGDELRHQRHLRALSSKLAHRLAAALGGEVAMLGGGTLINSNEGELRNYERMWDQTGRPVPIFGTGVKAPEFWSSTPGWSDRRKEWVALLNRLPIMGVRGPISRTLLEEAGAQNVIICGDPAVWYHVPLGKMGKRNKFKQRRCVGINWGRPAGGMWGQMAQVEEVLADVARELQQSGLEIQLLPVCPQDVEGCCRIAELAGLGKESVQPVFASVSSFLRAAAHIELLIAMKLHAAVLAAVTSLPFLLLEYQPKCRDFTSSIGWQRFTIRTDAVGKHQLMNVISNMLDQRAVLEEELCESMCRLSKGFEEYCCIVEGLLMTKGRAGVTTMTMASP